MNILVAGFPRSIDAYSLEKIFRHFGDVDEVNIWVHHEERSLRFAIVQMPNENQARRAIRTVNGDDSLGRMLWVEQAPEALGTLRRLCKEASRSSIRETHDSFRSCS